MIKNIIKKIKKRKEDAIFNKIRNKVLKGSIYDDKLREQREKRRRIDFDYYMDEAMCGWGDEWWKD